MSTDSLTAFVSVTPATGAAPSGSGQADVGRPPPLSRPWLVQTYKVSRLALSKVQVGLSALHEGFWLGVLDKPLLDAACERYYEEKPVYQTYDYNRAGLYKWEQEMLDRFFPSGGKVLVTSAGGGREVLALHRCGYQLVATECNPRLVAFANQFLQTEQVPCLVQLVAPDDVPREAHGYDAIVVGCGAYMLIQGSARRIEFLRALRARLNDGAPLLLSFFTRNGDSPYFRLLRGIANCIRALLRRERIDLGDSLTPVYAHYFHEDEVAAEIRAAGLDLVYFGDTDYGHAVARKSTEPRCAASA